MISWILKIIIITLIALGQITFNSSNNFLLSNVNLLIIFGVLSIKFFDLPFKLIFVIFSGFILDLYSNLPFGSFMITLFLISIFWDILFYNFFTDQSLFSILILSVIGVTIYNFSFILILGGSYLLGFTDFFINQSYIWNYFLQLLFNGCLVMIGFYLLNRLLKSR